MEKYFNLNFDGRKLFWIRIASCVFTITLMPCIFQAFFWHLASTAKNFRPSLVPLHQRTVFENMIECLTSVNSLFFLVLFYLLFQDDNKWQGSTSRVLVCDDFLDGVPRLSVSIGLTSQTLITHQYFYWKTSFLSIFTPEERNKRLEVVHYCLTYI